VRAIAKHQEKKGNNCRHHDSFKMNSDRIIPKLIKRATKFALNVIEGYIIYTKIDYYVGR
jgi:hypothetical protein